MNKFCQIYQTLIVKFILLGIVSTKLLELLNLLHITSNTLWSNAVEFIQGGQTQNQIR